MAKSAVLKAAFLFLATALVTGSPASAGAPCTDGVDCYCDLVRDPASSKYDPEVLFCEDFEAPTLTQDTNVGGRAPIYGPWYDDTDFEGARGANSYWTKTYGSANNTCAWGQGQGGPTGSPCEFGTCFAGEWSSGDPWGSNQFACMDVVRNGEFDDEVRSNQEPVRWDGTSGVLDGNQSMGWRVGAGRTSGIVGRATLSREVTEFGITMALAYAANIENSGIWAYPWKHHEWGNGGSGPYIEFWNLGNTGVGQLPYSGFMFHRGESECNAALAGATVTVGQAACSSVALRLGAVAPQYDQKRDFPWGTWGCHRGHIRGMGTRNMEIRMWHNEVLIFEMRGFDGRALRNQSYSEFAWNDYSNANQGLGASPTSQTTYRYEDNLHVRAGVPVSCESINFGDLSQAPPPPPPGPDPIDTPPAPPVLLD